MDLGTNVILFIVGGLAILVGIMFRRWAGRHDLRGALTDSAWQLARGRRRGGRKTDIEEKFAEIASAATTAGRVRRAGGSVIGHFMSTIVGLTGLVLILAGLATIAAGYFMA
jgi:hypothetical protein